MWKKFLSRFTAKSTLLLGGLLLPGITFAQAADPGSGWLQGLAEILSLFITVLTFFALLILDFGGHLIGTDMITGDQAMEAIRPMWVFIRNITNIGFVVLILFLAVANLASSFTGQGNWTIKDKLPKIILSIIAINVSLLGMRVAVDAVHVGTISILSLSSTALESEGIESVEDMLKQESPSCKGEADCPTVYERINSTFCSEGDKKGDSCFFSINPEGLKNVNNQDSRNLFLAFGIFFQNLQDLPLLAPKITQWRELLQNTLFTSILSIAYIVALVAVFIALLARVVALWIFMVLSPLLVAGAIIGFNGGGGLGKKFVNNLIMPLKIALAFSVSFVMLMAISKYEVFNVQENGQNFIKLGKVLTQFGTSPYAILWQIVTVIVFWKAAFWAIEDNFAKGITEGIKKGAETAGQYITKAATVDQQIMQVPGFEGISPATLARLPEMLRQKRNMEQSKEYNRMSQMFGLTPAAEESIRKLTSATSSRTDKDKTVEALRSIKKEDWSNPQVAKLLMKLGLVTEGFYAATDKLSQLEAGLKKDENSAVLAKLEKDFGVMGARAVSEKLLSGEAAASGTSGGASSATKKAEIQREKGGEVYLQMGGDTYGTNLAEGEEEQRQKNWREAYLNYKADNGTNPLAGLSEADKRQLYRTLKGVSPEKGKTVADIENELEKLATEVKKKK